MGGVSIEFFSNLFTTAFASAVLTAAAPPPGAHAPMFEVGDSENGKLLPALPSFSDEAERETDLYDCVSGCSKGSLVLRGELLFDVVMRLRGRRPTAVALVRRLCLQRVADVHAEFAGFKSCDLYTHANFLEVYSV